MRLGFDLCEEEKSFLHKRKQVVAAALKSILQLKEDLLDHEVSGQYARYAAQRRMSKIKQQCI